MPSGRTTRPTTATRVARAPLMATAHPVPAFPVAILITSSLLFVEAIAVGAAHSRLVAIAIGVAALVPFRRASAMREMGRWLAILGAAACVVGVLAHFVATVAAEEIASAAGHVHLGAPLVLALAIPLLLLRASVLEGEAARRWTSTAWILGTTAPQLATSTALDAALRAPPPDPADPGDDRLDRAVDAAIVALALAGDAIVPEEIDARRVFWIHVYAILAMHAGRERLSSRWADRNEAARTRYAVAGQEVSLDAIERVLLRADKPASDSLLRVRISDELRERWGVPADARVPLVVHRGLHRGTASTPSPRVFRGRDLDAQLDIAAAAFVGATTRIDRAHQRLELHSAVLASSKEAGVDPRAHVERLLSLSPGSLAGMRVSRRPTSSRSSRM